MSRTSCRPRAGSRPTAPESYGRGMTVTDDEVGPADEDMRRTVRDVRRVARLLMQGLEPDHDGPNLLQVLEEHLGVQPDTLRRDQRGHPAAPRRGLRHRHRGDRGARPRGAPRRPGWRRYAPPHELRRPDPARPLRQRRCPRPGRVRADGRRPGTVRPPQRRRVGVVAVPLRRPPGRRPDAGGGDADGRPPLRTARRPRRRLRGRPRAGGRGSRAHAGAQHPPGPGRDLRRRPLRPGTRGDHLLRAPGDGRATTSSFRTACSSASPTTSSVSPNTVRSSPSTVSTSSAGSSCSGRPGPERPTPCAT